MMLTTIFAIDIYVSEFEDGDDEDHIDNNIYTCVWSSIDDTNFDTNVPQGKTKVDSIDDDEELLYTEDAFNVLGFSDQEKFDCYM